MRNAGLRPHIPLALTLVEEARNPFAQNSSPDQLCRLSTPNCRDFLHIRREIAPPRNGSGAKLSRNLTFIVR
jgi:hypothetical protein